MNRQREDESVCLAKPKRRENATGNLQQEVGRLLELEQLIKIEAQMRR